MQSFWERGVPPGEHTERGVPDWESARLFLHIVRHGSFRAAAESLNQSVNALRRRLNEFEQRLGMPLVTRHVDGVRMTREGERIFAAAERMETVSFDLLRERDKAENSIAGEVRLAVTEGLGTFWIAPRLVEFQRAYPQLLVEMSCGMRPANVLRLEADLSVQITRPEAKDLTIRKLGRLHVMPFASRSYIATFGKPSTVAELAQHRIVLQVAAQIPGTEYDRLFPGLAQPGHVALRTNTSSAHLWAIARGAGVGMLPTYAHAIAADIVPVEVGYRLTQDIWLSYHPDAKRIARVRRLIDWLVDAFSPRKHPWFRDEFIPPDQLPIGIAGSTQNNFASFDGPDSVKSDGGEPQPLPAKDDAKEPPR